MMNKAQKIKAKIILLWVTVILCMLAIFLLSNQPAGTSNATSREIVQQGVETTVRVIKADITESKKWEIINNINSAGREYMHGVVFLVLGFLMLIAMTQSGARGLSAVVISLAICVIYALTDEIHQIFVPDRAFQISDLVMDFFGSILGIGISFVTGFLYSKRAFKLRHKRQI